MRYFCKLPTVYFATVFISLLGMSTASAGVLPVGIQTNVSQSTVDTWGWSECHSSDAGGSVDFALNNTCTGSYIAMGLWDASLGAYGVIGAGESAAVLDINFNHYNDDNNLVGPIGNLSNNLYWYRAGNGSWGFSTTGEIAMHGADVNLQNGINNWDQYGVQETVASAGLSLHTYGGTPTNIVNGWAYNTDGHNFTNVTFGDTRVFWTFETQAVSAPSTLVLISMALAAMAMGRRNRRQF